MNNIKNTDNKNKNTNNTNKNKIINNTNKNNNEKNALIIYEKNDAELNQFFIQKITQCLRKRGIELTLKYRNEVDGSEKTDFVINRSRDYKLSERYEKNNIRVFNNSAITRIGNDKKLSQEMFEEKVPMMPLTENYPCVIKSVAGHGGKEVFLVHSRIEEDKTLIGNKDYIKQEVATDTGIDKRVYVIGNEIVAAVKRSSDDFRSNFSLGGKAELSDVSTKERMIIQKILEGIYADYVGIDFIYNNGEPVFNEMEDAVGARMLYNSSSIDVIELFAEHICKEMQEKVD